MKFGFWELILLFCIILILFGPTVIPWVHGWLRRAEHTKKQIQRQQEQVRRQAAAERDALLHRFQVVTSFLLIVGFVGYAAFLVLHTPAAVPQAYEPSTAAMSLTTAGNTQTTALDLAPYEKPLCVAWQDGWLYAAVKGNKVIRIREDGTGLTEVFTTDSEISGMAFGPDGSLYLAGGNAIYRASFDGWAVDVKPILTDIDGAPLVSPSAIAVAADGTVYFTQYAQQPIEQDGLEQRFFNELLAHTDSGTAYVLDPHTGEAERLTGGLSGAGGIAVSPDGKTIYLSETNARRVWAYPADARTETVQEAGEILLDGLDGYAAGLSLAQNGDVWAAVCGKPISWVDKTAGAPLLRKVVLNLPDLTQHWLLTPKADTGWAFSISDDGTLSRAVAAQLPNMDGRITGICETETTIWLANADAGRLYGITR